MTNLYRYLPLFIRLRDRVASGLTDDDSREAVLEKVVAVLALVFDEYDEFIQELITIQDADACDPRYFMHLSYVLGTLLPTGGDEFEIRFIIKNLVSHYKTKGTHHSWGIAWNWQDVVRPRVVELYKTTPEEVGNYSAFPSANYSMRSARIDLTSCQTSCETVCESVCESVCEASVEVGTRLSISSALDRLRYVEYLRPIHVLLRREAEDVAIRSAHPGATDTLGHYPLAYAQSPTPWMGSYIESDFQEPWMSSGDEVEIEAVCIGLCETTCQTCCQTTCECAACEESCQAGGCELACTTNCQGQCEFQCEHSCQFACTACEAACTAAACMAGCTACEANCTAACAAGDCQSGCTGTACEYACTVCEADCTVGDCQVGCAAAGCQYACTVCESDCTVHSVVP